MGNFLGQDIYDSIEVENESNLFFKGKILNDFKSKRTIRVVLGLGIGKQLSSQTKLLEPENTRLQNLRTIFGFGGGKNKKNSKRKKHRRRKSSKKTRKILKKH